MDRIEEDGNRHAYGPWITGAGNVLTFNWAPERTRQRDEMVPRKRTPTQEEQNACLVVDQCDPDLFDRYVTHYDVQYALDRFVLKEPRAYIGTLFLTKPASVYARADLNAGQKTIEAGSFVAVLAMTPEWAQVDRFNQDGSSTRGWINRDDLYEVEWVDQAGKTADYRFRVAYADMNDWEMAGAAAARSGAPVAIEVLDRKTSKRAQVIRDFDTDMQPLSEDAMSLVDANFDGHLDLQILGNGGGAGPNSSFNFFLFEPKTKQFVFDDQLSGLMQISISAHDRTITSAQRDGCCHQLSQTYRYQGKKLVMVANWEQTHTADDWLVTKTGTLVKGVMRYHTTRTRPEPGNP